MHAFRKYFLLSIMATAFFATPTLFGSHHYHHLSKDELVAIIHEKEHKLHAKENQYGGQTQKYMGPMCSGLFFLLLITSQKNSRFI